MKKKQNLVYPLSAMLFMAGVAFAQPATDVFFGNLHVHTNWSFDGYTNGAITGPDEAYRWAKGEAIPGGGGGPDIKVKIPLDWYVVSDHAEYLGVFKEMGNPDSLLSKLEIAKRVTSDDPTVSFAAYAEVLEGINKGQKIDELADPEIGKTIWQDMVSITDSHYVPGKFTTFPSFEWTSAPGERNMHRVVVFRDSANVPDMPFSTLDSNHPEDLWAYMENAREEGATVLAVPHNGNASDGWMFADTDSDGRVLDQEYAETRSRNEPLYEIAQIKGTSETHPLLSPKDEFANFELWEYTLSADALPPRSITGSYAREALLKGIRQQALGKGNPFKYGFIGDSDTHNSATPLEEDNYTGKFAFENNPEHRLHGPAGVSEANKQQVREFGSAGVAGVWARANTRVEIYNALARKETYGTSGPRMRLRFFGGFDFASDDLEPNSWVENAYRRGVPMGGDLGRDSKGKAPVFLVHALKEANGANLDRIQIVKGWVKDNVIQERIYNVVLSDDRTAKADGNIPSVGNTVDAFTATYTNDIGDTQLTAIWADPDFDAKAHAFYYARILQIPTPRWSTYDAVTLGTVIPDGLPSSIQERAWSSPIWYTP